MNLAHVTRRFDPSDWGGTETVILALGRVQQARGHAVRVVSTRAGGCAARERVGGVCVERVGHFYPYLGLSREARERLDRKGGNPFSFALARHLLALPSLDLIHLHVGLRLGGIARSVARRRGIPYVLSLHGGLLDVPEDESRSWTDPTRGTLDWGKPLGLWVGSRNVLRDAAALLCVNRSEAARLQERYPRQRVVHLPNGIDAGRFSAGDALGFRRKHAIPAAARVLSCIARIDGQKNQALLVEALPALLARVPEAHLLLVGSITDPAYRARLEARVAALGLRERVTLVPGLPGASAELVDAYHASDVFVLPSIHEPFGIAILEAWAAGVPVVASRVGGIVDLVEEGRDGLLFASNDARALGEHLASLLTSPERRTVLSRAGLGRVTRDFSWERVADQVAAIYDDARGREDKRDD